MHISQVLMYVVGFIVLLDHQLVIKAKKQICYQAHFLKLNSSDTPPRYLVSMSSTKSGNISMRVIVNQEIRVPFTNFAIIQTEDRTQRITVIYNMTRKACEFFDIITKVPMVKTIMAGTMRSSNFSFSCPLTKGVYVVDNFMVRSTNPMFSILHNPKKTITVYGGTSEQKPDKSLKAVSRYMIRLKVVKRKC